MPLLCVILYFFYLKFSYIIYRYEIVQRIPPESLNDILKKFHEWFPKTSCFEKIVWTESKVLISTLVCFDRYVASKFVKTRPESLKDILKKFLEPMPK